MADNRRVAQAALVVLAMNLFSRLLGFGRDAVIAAAYGATRATDAYMVAYTLPYSLQAVLGMAFATVMVPLVTAHLQRGEREEAWRSTSAVLGASFLVLSLLTAAGLACAPALVRLMAPGFTPDAAALATHLTRIMFPSVIFMGLGMLITGVLNAGGSFALPAFAPALANLVVIAAVAALGRRYWVPALAWGTLAGFVAFFLVQLPGLRRLGFRWRGLANLGHPAVRQVGEMVLPVLLAVAVGQVYLALNRFFASGLAQGTITALDLANRVLQLPLGIFAAAVSTAIFPTLSALAAGRAHGALARAVERGAGVVWLVSLPAAAGLVILREPLIRLLFEHGSFDPRGTALTATALALFAPGLPALGLNMVLQRVFYARGDVRTPMRLGAASVGVDVVLSLVLLPRLGHAGLALANSLAAWAYAAGLLAAVKRWLPQFALRRLAAGGLRVLVATGLMAAVVGWLAGPLGARAGESFSGLFLLLGALSLLGAVVFAGAVVTLRVDEARWLLGMLRPRRQPAGKVGTDGRNPLPGGE